MDTHLKPSFVVSAQGRTVRFLFQADARVERLRTLYAAHSTDAEPTLDVEVSFVGSPNDLPRLADSAPSPSSELLVFRTASVRGGVDLRRGVGEVAVCRAGGVESFGLFFRVLYTALAREAFRTFVHASATVHRGVADLFVGPSGAGKTTAVRLAGGRIVHDDTVFLAGEEDPPAIETAPFTGDEGCIHGTLERFAVGRIFLLRKAERPFLVPASPARVLGRLLTLPWEEIGGSTRADSRDYLEASMRRCKGLVESARCFELHFTRERLPEALMETTT